MHPNISEQLAGLSKVLTDVVQPELSDPYPVEMLNGVIAALDTLSRSWDELPRYLRWDAAATAAVLAQVGIATTAPPADQLDHAALEAHHGDVRAALEQAIPVLLADPDANAATVQLFRDRIERFPFNQLAPRR
jgi:hypothetical protein